RAALLEAWKGFRTLRAWLIDSWCRPWYGAVIREAVARGLIDAPGFFDHPLITRAWLGANWTGPSPGQIDPLKEAQAAKLRVEEGFSTRQQETAELTGGDWEANHEQRAKEERLRREAGLGREGTAERAISEHPQRDSEEETGDEDR